MKIGDMEYGISFMFILMLLIEIIVHLLDDVFFIAVLQVLTPRIFFCFVYSQYGFVWRRFMLFFGKTPTEAFSFPSAVGLDTTFLRKICFIIFRNMTV